MALTQISTQGIKDGTITGTDLATNVDLVDNQKLRIGTSNDLQIYHDGSNSYIQDTDQGNLFIEASAVLIRKNGTTENIAKFIQDGAVELYYDNSKKLNTNTNGVHITDTLTFANTGDSVLLADNQNVSCGNGGDLKIFHDGTSSRIHNATGNLTIKSNSILGLYTYTGTEAMAKFTANGAVELYYDNSKKFETTSGGVQVTDNLNMSGGHIFLADNYKLNVGTGDDLQIFHDGSNSYIANTNSSGHLLIASHQTRILNSGSTENIAKFIENGAVELYYDNVKTFATKAGGNTLYGTDASGNVSLGRFYFKQESGTVRALYDPNAQKFQHYDNTYATFGNGDDLKIYHNGTHSYIENATGGLYIKVGNGEFLSRNGAEVIAKFLENGACELYHDNTKRIFTESAGGAISGKSRFLGHGQGSGANSTEVHFNSDNSHIGIHFSGHGNTGNTYTAARMVINGTGGTYGTITYSLSGTGYNSQSSDSRSKKNIVEWAESELDKFKNLQPKLFHFDHNEDSDPKYKGYIAQDNLTAFPEAYNLVDDRYMFNPSGMVHYLMKAMQELVSKVEVLETEVAALKAA